jgi:hypothetical protein
MTKLLQREIKNSINGDANHMGQIHDDQRKHATRHGPALKLKKKIRFQRTRSTTEENINTQTGKAMMIKEKSQQDSSYSPVAKEQQAIIQRLRAQYEQDSPDAKTQKLTKTKEGRKLRNKSLSNGVGLFCLF